MNAHYKTLAATFTGGFLGTLSMRALSPSFWWIGMIVGAVVGFIMKSEKEIREEVTKGDFSLEPNMVSLCKDFFIPVIERCATALRGPLKGVVIALTALTLIATITCNLLTFFLIIKERSLTALVNNLDIMTFWQWTGCHIALIASLAVAFPFIGSFKKRLGESLVLVTIVSPVSFTVVFPLACSIIAAAIIYYLLIWTHLAWKAIAIAGTKIWNDTTYACATASALGACIGHYAGDNPLVGGGAGVILALARIKIHEAVGKVLSK